MNSYGLCFCFMLLGKHAILFRFLNYEKWAMIRVKF